MMPIPAPMPAPDSPRSPVAVPQPDNSTAANIPIATNRMLETFHFIERIRLGTEGGGIMACRPGHLHIHERLMSVRIPPS